MATWRRSLADGLWALDKVLGGQRRPTRFQKWAGRHPVQAGLWVAAPLTLFLWLVSGDETDSPLFVVIGGLATWLILGLTAASERLRQRRLKRLGIWDGS
ncbi:hypothetical protein ACFVXH_35260 [Kitasatospora sp. NPDC058184]|uniref:hypothetical protein n=1 Tax=unclassified Kitasatospora TaxID=2633591 RepID=UPI00369BF4DB